MLSLTCKAAIKAVIYLGSKSELDEKCSIKQIADGVDENEHTVGKLLQKLVKEKVINSSKGPTGGFYITKDQQKKSLMTIVKVFDGEVVFKQCGLGLNNCNNNHPCAIHNDYKIVRDGFKQLCQDKKIIDLTDSENISVTAAKKGRTTRK
jgi:Rrf2 family protein